MIGHWGAVSGRDHSVGKSDLGGPPLEVVREGGDHSPCGVGEEPTGRECANRLVFEVTNRELHDGVLTVLGLDLLERVGAVGQERVVAAVGQSSACAPTRQVRQTIRRWDSSIVCAICAFPPTG